MAQKKRVVHKPVTQETTNDMPKTPHVFLRGNVFYVRKRVPTELVPVLHACEIKVSLKTSDRKEALANAPYALVHLAAQFDEARKVLARNQVLFPVSPPLSSSARELGQMGAVTSTTPRFFEGLGPLIENEAIESISAQGEDLHRATDRKAVARPMRIKELAESEIHRIVASYFICREKRNSTWFENEVQHYGGEDLKRAWDNLTGDISHYQTTREKRGKVFGSPVFDPSGLAEQCLEELGIELPSDSPSFAKLAQLLRRALVETTARMIARVEPLLEEEKKDKKILDRSYHGDPYFNALNADAVEPQQKPTLKKLLDGFQKHHEKNSSAGTQRTYNIPIRLLLQHFGEGCPLSAIGPQQIGELFDLLEKVPRNAQQRYPKKSLQESIVDADKNKDPDRLAAKTLVNYHRNIVAIFNYGKEDGMLSANPASSKLFKNRFKGKRIRRVPFQIDELQKLFDAPLYKGSIDDERNYAKPGANVVRRGRFWVPLLALYHGFRCNETCQLYTEDVKLKDEVWCIWISKSADENEDEETGKKIKNESSERLVPIHKTLIQLGFLNYVAERRKDTTLKNLFPELGVDRDGYHSNLFSKWFGRFKNKYAPGCKATFHGFRHTWRTQLTRFDISIEDVEQLGGWSSERRSSERIYSHGKTIPAIKAVLDRVEYPGLDLTHLVPHTASQEAPKVYPRRSRPVV